MICLLTEVDETGAETPGLVYINDIKSIDFDGETVTINKYIQIPKDNFLEIKFKKVIK